MIIIFFKLWVAYSVGTKITHSKNKIRYFSITLENFLVIYRKKHAASEESHEHLMAHLF